MHKNTSILCYFKPFAQSPRLNKRSLPEDDSREPRVIVRSRSTTREGSQTIKGHDRRGGNLEEDLPRTSSRVTLRSTIRQPPGSGDRQPTESAGLASVSRNETSYTPLTPIPNGPVSQNLDFLSSQRPSSMSSQRVVKNGEVVIQNSDDESCSDSSLEDLNHLLRLEGPKTQREMSYPEPQLPFPFLNGTAENGRRMSRRHRTKTETGAAPLPSALPLQAKRHKFDLESLARHRKQEEASTEVFTRASAMLRSLEHQKISAVKTLGAASTTVPLAATSIEKVLRERGAEDEVSRLKAAIQRTEVLGQGKMWSFFDKRATEPLFEQREFPIRENDHLGRMLGKSPARQQAFLGGYASDVARKERLSEEVLLWIMDAVCVESRDDLRCSYTATLTDASRDMVSVLSPERINMLFRKIGASAGALNIEGTICCYPALSQSVETVSRPNLLSILDLFQGLAVILDAGTRMHLLCTLCRLVLDHSVANSCHVIRAIEDTFASLVESIPEQDLDHELQVVMTTVFRTITDTNLRLHLLQNVPASSHRLILIRRRLALAFFSQDVRYLSQHADSTIDLKGIARHLEDPHYIISNATDYSELAAAVAILSIAIDCSNPPSSPYATENEKTFNHDIDALSLKINSMFAEIVDTGASHVGRTEAKEVLEAFQYWLSYGIRTKHPPKKALFGDSTLEGMADRNMMEAFVDKGKQDISFAQPGSV